MQGTKKMRHLTMCALFLVFLSGLDALTTTERFAFSGFRGRPKIAPLVSSTAANKALCAIACVQLAACKSFSFRSGTEGCSLFPRRIMALDVDLSVPLEDAHFSRVIASCPSWKGFVTVPGTIKCIRVGKVNKSWIQAAQDCDEDGSRLLIIENADVMQKLEDFLPEEYYHVGFTDEDTEDQHLWLDRTPVNRAMFFPSEPNDASTPSVDDCGLFSNKRLDSGLHDTSCFTKRKFLCSLPTKE